MIWIKQVFYASEVTIVISGLTKGHFTILGHKHCFWGIKKAIYVLGVIKLIVKAKANHAVKATALLRHVCLCCGN